MTATRQGKRKNPPTQKNAKRNQSTTQPESTTRNIKLQPKKTRKVHTERESDEPLVAAESSQDEDMEEDDDEEEEEDDSLPVEGIEVEADDDMSQSEEEEEEDEGEDEEGEQSDMDTKIPKGKGKGNKQPTDEENSATFANAMANILGSTLKVADRKAPILAKSKGAERRIEEAKLEHRARKAITTEKKKLASKDRVVPDYTRLDYERKLKKVATKGVVKLFNAIKEHHKLGSEDTLGKSAATKEKVASMSKANFLDLLKSGGEIEQ